MRVCEAPECTEAAAAGALMCDPHWSKVPARLRTGVERTWAAWHARRSDVAAFQAYQLAKDAAVRAVNPWTVDMAAVCCCPCHRGAGSHLVAGCTCGGVRTGALSDQPGCAGHDDADLCLCAQIGPASCLRCRQPLAAHAVSPDQLHGIGSSHRTVELNEFDHPVTKEITAAAHTTFVCPTTLADRHVIPGVTPPALRAAMRDDREQLELAGAPA